MLLPDHKDTGLISMGPKASHYAFLGLIEKIIGLVFNTYLKYFLSISSYASFLHSRVQFYLSPPCDWALLLLQLLLLIIANGC
jgi:hypothetical protein